MKIHSKPIVSLMQECASNHWILCTSMDVDACRHSHCWKLSSIVSYLWILMTIHAFCNIRNFRRFAILITFVVWCSHVCWWPPPSLRSFCEWVLHGFAQFSNLCQSSSDGYLVLSFFNAFMCSSTNLKFRTRSWTRPILSAGRGPSCFPF